LLVAEPPIHGFTWKT